MTDVLEEEDGKDEADIEEDKGTLLELEDAGDRSNAPGMDGKSSNTVDDDSLDRALVLGGRGRRVIAVGVDIIL